MNPTRKYHSDTRLLALASTLLTTLCVLTPRAPAEELEGCTVTIGGARWEDGGCPTPTLAIPSTNDLPIMKSKCDVVYATAGGANFYSEDCGVTTVGVFTPGSYHDDGTGCDVEIVSSSPASTTWKFYNPKKSGTITVTAELSGYCNGPECTLTPVHYKAVGILQVTLPPDTDPSDGGGGGGSGCQKCTLVTPTLGNGAVVNNADNEVEFRQGLGLASPRADAAFIWLRSSSASTNLATPAMLQAPFIRSNVQVFWTNGAIRQAKVAQGLVHIKTVSDYEYHLENYYDSDVVHPAQSDGFYATNSGATPFVTWIVKNPDGATNCNRLWITEQRGGAERQFQFSNNVANLQWDLVLPDGHVNSTWRAADGGDPNTTNYFWQATAGGQLVSKRQRVIQFVPGITNTLLLREILGDGMLTQTTTYTYYTNTSSSNLLQRVDYPNGNWTYFTYDGTRRKIKEYSAFANSSPPSDPRTEPDPLTDHCRLTTYCYALTNSTDGIDDSGDPSDPWAVRKTIVSIPVLVGGAWELHETSRTYHLSVVTNGYDEVRQCVAPGAHWDDANNLVTVTWQNAGVGFPAGLPEYTSHPDGTETSYSYPDELTTIRSDPDGTQTETITDGFGNIMSRTRTDVGTSVILSRETYNYKDQYGAYLDALGRSYDMINLADRTNQVRYSCCGLDYTIDTDGVSSSFDYDSLKRQVAATRTFGGSSGIKTTNVLDAAGRVLKSLRIGTNGTTVSMEQIQYDLLGRVVRRTNALGGVSITTNVIASGRLCVTNTNPDGGTRIETYYRDGRLESVSGTAAAPMRYIYSAEQDGSYWRETTTEIRLDSMGGTNEWTRTFTDGAGNNYKTAYSAASGTPPSNQSLFNSKGQLWKQVDLDGVTTLYAYNSSTGEREYTIAALSGTALGLTDYADLVTDLGDSSFLSGPDRITRNIRSVVAADSSGPDRTAYSTYVWTDGNSSGTLKSARADSADGLNHWTTNYGNSATLVSASCTHYGSASTRYVTNTAADGSLTLSTYSYGLITSSVHRDSLGAQISGTSYYRDAHERVYAATDARNGTTFYGFNDADQITSVTTPAPGPIGAAQVTTTYYDPSLQSVRVVLPDGAAVTNEYSAMGQIRAAHGGRNYPFGDSFDAQGRMTTMTNWSSFPSTGPRVTTWSYEPYRGWLSTKTYDGGAAGPSYAYTPAGRLKTRLWARGIYTTNSYNIAGDLRAVTYSDATPGITNGYDRLGRQTSITNGSAVCLRKFDLAANLLSETWLGGPLDGIVVSNRFDSLLRRTNVSVLSAGSVLLSSTAYSYDSASRLHSVTSGTNVAVYSYLANSPLVSQIFFTNGSTLRMTTIKQWDHLNRLTSISSTPSVSSAVSFSYSYNDANQRTRRRDADGSMWQYSYDKLGQLTSGKKFWPDWTPVAGQQFEYAFDEIGNRISTKAGGNENGTGLRTANYSANSLNQYSFRDIPPATDVLGLSYATNFVMVNGQTAYRKGEYFRAEVSLDNSSSALWTNIEVSATAQAGTTGKVFLAKSPETFGYDADGNMTNDGRWVFTWDAENRLISMESLSNAPAGSKLRLEFAYDSQWRRVQKTVYTNNGSAYGANYTNRFAYDAWNLVALLSPDSVLRSSFVWGSDLSGTLQGAGGVGGLAFVNDQTTISNVPSTHLACFDGNGNIAQLVNAGNGSYSAQYEYGAFGELVRSTGPMATANSSRWSTKYQDDETGMSYYGYRYYNSSTGRWVTRDAIAEKGGRNIYEFVLSDPTSKYDLLGLDSRNFVPYDGFGSYTVNIDVYPISLCDRQGNASLLILGSVDTPTGIQDFRPQDGAQFTVDGVLVPFTITGDDTLHTFAFSYGKIMPTCPRGRQEGYIFVQGQYHDDKYQTLWISAFTTLIHYTYRCACACTGGFAEDFRTTFDWTGNQEPSDQDNAQK
jgi:RHS repeat-associated protein